MILGTSLWPIASPFHVVCQAGGKARKMVKQRNPCYIMIHECDLMTNTDFNKTENLSKDALDKIKNYSKMQIMEIVTRLNRVTT